jgi:hypothetical protein
MRLQTEVCTEQTRYHSQTPFAPIDGLTYTEPPPPPLLRPGWVSAALSPGTLRPQRPRRSVTHYGPLGYTGETLRTRLGKYARSGRLGPLHEPHKDAFFQQQLQVGGQLCLR